MVKRVVGGLVLALVLGCEAGPLYGDVRLHTHPELLDDANWAIEQWGELEHVHLSVTSSVSSYTIRIGATRYAPNDEGGYQLGYTDINAWSSDRHINVHPDTPECLRKWVIVHELGHLMTGGLDHNSEGIMSSSMNGSCSANRAVLESDHEWIESYYQGGGW